ncbi:MAG: mRNA surveillance protein pelota [Nanoarchaeota archaeon]
MKLLNKGKEDIKVQIENMDDLWYLSNIVDVKDLVKGKTLRKIKIGEKEQRNVKVIRKPVFIEIQVEKIEFSKSTNALRLLGKITQGPEDVQKGEHHSFSLEENSIITIKKENWLKYQLDKLKEACSEKVANILIIVHDREEAYFALMKKYGFELLSHIQGDVQKKREEKKIEKPFYQEIINITTDYVKKYKIQNIILASPSFWKEDLMNELKDQDIKSKITLATCSSVDKTAINEVLKRDEVKNVLYQDRIAKEMRLVDELLFEIKKGNLSVYGLKDTGQAVVAGAVKTLLVTDALIQKSREQESYEKIDSLMKTADSTKSDVHIISSEHDGGKKLDGLGGIAALLRYRLN